jgi:hypothetical protein
VSLASRSSALSCLRRLCSAPALAFALCCAPAASSAAPLSPDSAVHPSMHHQSQ